MVKLITRELRRWFVVFFLSFEHTYVALPNLLLNGCWRLVFINAGERSSALEKKIATQTNLESNIMGAEFAQGPFIS